MPGRVVSPPPTMDISALVNHDAEGGAVLPRRSLSHSVPALSPVSPAAKLPSTPTTSSASYPSQPMQRKRKRHDPKPIWAYLENEELPPELQRAQEQREKERQAAAAQASPAPQPQAPAQAQQPPPPPRNGPTPVAPNQPPRKGDAAELMGFERPVSNDAQVYDEVSRKVCDFIWVQAVSNDLIRSAIAESNLTQLEVEARWGQVQDIGTNSRLRGVHDTECVVKNGVVDVRFESTMTMEQHKRMNMYLNGQVRESKVPGAPRPAVDYQHTKEADLFYELDQEGFNQLPPRIQHIISQSGTRQRVRVTRDAKTQAVLRSIIKLRIANLEISSPQTEWDYRIGINLEVTYPGPVDNLQPVVEPGRTPDSMTRIKDRMSYSWLGAYQVDLTQVVQGTKKNHELELELDAGMLLDHADRVRAKEPNKFESLIAGMMNNLRVLSREITPPASGS